MNKSLILMACLVLSACKLDFTGSTEQSNESSTSRSNSVSNNEKVSASQQADVSVTQPLGSIQVMAWQNMMEYATGNSFADFAMKAERNNTSTDSLVFVTKVLTINPIVAGKPNPFFFAGADRNPAMPWQQTVTNDLIRARSDLNDWIADGSKGELPQSVRLMQARYSAVLNIMFTFNGGGAYFAGSQINQVLHGAFATESASRTMGRIITVVEPTGTNFQEIRSQLVSGLLNISLEQFDEDRQWLQHYSKSINQSQMIVLNKDKGALVNGSTYINEAGKNTGWQKHLGGVVVYSSNIIAGKDYAFSVKQSRSASNDLSSDIKLSSDLKETVGSKVSQAMNLSTGGGQ
jgi:hypothetical protein